jgi:hypothetical protein
MWCSADVVWVSDSGSVRICLIKNGSWFGMLLEFVVLEVL